MPQTQTDGGTSSLLQAKNNQGGAEHSRTLVPSTASFVFASQNVTVIYASFLSLVPNKPSMVKV